MVTSSIRTLAALAAAGLLCTACATREPVLTEVAPLPLDQFKAPVVSDEREFALTQRPELSPAQQEGLAHLVSDWRNGGSGPVTIRVPTEADSYTFRTVDNIVGALRALGVTPREVQHVGYASPEGPRGLVRVGFFAHTVEIPRCGIDHGDYTKTGANRVNANFGCAVNANIAVQVANPADLVGPRNEDPADAGRRQTVLERYRAGEVTSSEKDDQADGSVSDVQ